MGRAWGYVRCSAVDRDDPHLGEATQRRQLRAYASLRGLTLGEVIEDLDQEGGVPLEARPGGGRLVELLRRPEARGDAVLITQLERLFSSVAECVAALEAWTAHGVTLHILDLDGQTIDTSSSLGRFLLAVLGTAQTMEVEAARERSRAAHQAKRPARQGRPLLGERVVRGYVLPDPDEQRAVDRIQEMSQQGKSLRTIAEALDEEGVPTKRRAKAWSKEAIRLILRRIERGEVRSLRGGDDDEPPPVA